MSTLEIRTIVSLRPINIHLRTEKRTQTSLVVGKEGGSDLSVNYSDNNESFSVPPPSLSFFISNDLVNSLEGDFGSCCASRLPL